MEEADDDIPCGGASVELKPENSDGKSEVNDPDVDVHVDVEDSRTDKSMGKQYWVQNKHQTMMNEKAWWKGFEYDEKWSC